MASIAKRPDGAWRARYRDAQGAQHAKHFRRKIDAQHWLEEVASQRITGTWVDPKRSRMTVGELADTWVKTPAWTESTRARNESILEKHVKPRWGSVKLSDVHHEDVQAWATELASSGIAGGTVRKIVGVLSGILRLAVKSNRLAVNPAKELSLPKQSLARRRYLTAGEVEALASAADDHSLKIYVLAYCGLRIGELSALRVRHVDMLRRRFRIEESVTEVNGELVWSAPKDHQRRSVPFPAFLADDLSLELAGRGPDDLVFTSSRGAPLRVRNMRRDWFDLAALAAGLEGLTPHELRHTAASLAVAAGASVLAVQRMLGHDKPSTTLDVYSDLFDADLDDVASRLDAARTSARGDFLGTSGASTGATVIQLRGVATP